MANPLYQFLGAFAELRKSDFWLCHVSLSARMEQLGFHWRDFREIWYSKI